MRTDGSDQNTKGAAPGAVAKPLSEEERARKTMRARILNMTKEFERALPGKIGVERVTRIVTTAIVKNPNLALREPNSFMGSLSRALQPGLEVNTPWGRRFLSPQKKTGTGTFFTGSAIFRLAVRGFWIYVTATARTK
jgi:recombinational DNA repair protein RecT